MQRKYNSILSHFPATDFSLTSISKLFASPTKNRRSRTDFLSNVDTVRRELQGKNSNLPPAIGYHPIGFFPLPSSPGKNGDPDQRDFPVIMHSRWRGDTRWWMSPGAKRELSVSKRILRHPARFFPMIYEHILQQRPMCRLLIQPLLPRLIYSRLISPTNENSNRWNRLRPTGEELQPRAPPSSSKEGER